MIRACFFALASFALACGGTTNPDDGGAGDAAPDVPIAPGCGTFVTQTFAVDASACVAQLAQTTSCQGEVCNWTVEVPCFDAAGAPDASAPDASDCTSWCKALAPANTTQTGDFCQPYTTDAGTFATCGGCGI